MFSSLPFLVFSLHLTSDNNEKSKQFLLEHLNQIWSVLNMLKIFDMVWNNIKWKGSDEMKDEVFHELGELFLENYLYPYQPTTKCNKD